MISSSQIDLPKYQEIASLERALATDPWEDAIRNNRGNALAKRGEYEEAIVNYDEALKINPGFDRAWYNKGNALDDLGRHEEAIDSYDRAIAINSKYYPAWFNRGFALEALGRYEEAIASYDRVLAINPDNDAAWYNKACCYGLQGEVELAVENLKRAIDLSPHLREEAKRDPDFDNIRLVKEFYILVYSQPEHFLPGESSKTGETLADFLEGYVGVLDSSEYFPEGSQLSQGTGEEFVKQLLES